jgi:hypothetical protein
VIAHSNICRTVSFTTATTAISYLPVTETPTANAPRQKRAITTWPVVPPGGIPAVNKRDVTVTPTAVPTYAPACDAAGFASACGCLGITAVTATAASTTSQAIVTSVTTSTILRKFE